MTTALHISIFNGAAFLWREGISPGDIKKLRQAVKAVTFGLKILKSNTESQFVWLPTRGDLPIDNMRCSRVGPAYIKARGRVLYDIKDLIEYLEVHKIHPEGK